MGERAPGEFAGGVRLAGPGSVVATPVGVRDSVRLLDGTIVVLAPASRLTLAADYGEGERNVSLDGAALFAVVHDSAHPFAVHAGNAVVRDVGTAFTVRADDDAGVVRIGVTEGAVSVDGPPVVTGDPLVLRKGDAERGSILLLHPSALEPLACECHDAIHQLHEPVAADHLAPAREA